MSVIKSLSSKGLKIFELRQKGFSVEAIAPRVGLSKRTVYHITSSQPFKLKQQQIEKSTMEKVQHVFESNAVKAAKKVCRLIKNGTLRDKIQLDAAKDVLDRIGYKPVQVIENIKRDYTPQEVISAHETLIEIEQATERITTKGSRFVLTGSPNGNPSEDESEDAEKLPQEDSLDDGFETTSPD